MGRASIKTTPCLCAAALALLASAAASGQQSAEGSEADSLRHEVDELTQLAVRTQSHVMIDVEYHFTNLWFAAEREQWDLASFYLREARSHLDWTVRIRPVRNVAGGGTVDLRPFQQIIKDQGFAQIAATLERKDHEAFVAAYRQTLSQCYACHTASGLPYLEPHTPEQPLSMLMIAPR
jgi:hypothetical protein